MNGLAGQRIGILEARRGAELAELVRRRGGEPRLAPAVAEVRADDRAGLTGALQGLGGAPDPVFVFTSGAGVAALFEEARGAGCEGVLRGLLSLPQATLACRGPKPVAALTREGSFATVRTREPHTEAELLGALAPVPLAGRPALLVHHGERSAGLAEALLLREARLFEVTPYAWRLPEDRAPLRALIEEITAGRLDALLFTSQIQARHLFAVAEEMGRAPDLRAALRARTVVASVGPTCTRALEALGLTAAVCPARSKMGPLVAALEQHLFTSRRTT